MSTARQYLFQNDANRAGRNATSAKHLCKFLKLCERFGLFD